MSGRRPVVVALGAVDPTLVTEVLGDRVEFVARPGPEDLANAEGAIVRADALNGPALPWATPNASSRSGNVKPGGTCPILLANWSLPHDVEMPLSGAPAHDTRRRVASKN